MPLNVRLPNKAAISPLIARTWFPVAAPEVVVWEDIIYATTPVSRFIAVGLGGAVNRVMRSANGKTGWATVDLPADCENLEWRTVAHQPSTQQLIALSGNSAGADLRVMQSLDGGATWSLQAQAVESTRYRHLIWIPEGARGFVGCGDGGAGRKLIRSATGVSGTWVTQMFSAVIGQPASIAFSPSLGRLLMVNQGTFGGAGRTQATYSDAWPPVDASWVVTPVGTLPDRTGLDTMVWERVIWIPDFGGRFVAVGNEDNIATSATGGAASWTQRAGSGYVADQQRTWVDVKYIAPKKRLVALYNGVAGLPHVGTSDDGGNTWSLVNASEANNWSSVAFGGSRAVAVASTGVNRIMISPN